jgi:hypothetical protein
MQEKQMGGSSQAGREEMGRAAGESVAPLVTVKHTGSGEIRQLEVLDVNCKSGAVYLRWPMGDALTFSAKDGSGRSRAKMWALEPDSLVKVRKWIKMRAEQLEAANKGKIPC